MTSNPKDNLLAAVSSKAARKVTPKPAASKTARKAASKVTRKTTDKKELEKSKNAEGSKDAEGGRMDTSELVTAESVARISKRLDELGERLRKSPPTDEESMASLTLEFTILHNAKKKAMGKWSTDFKK